MSMQDTNELCSDAVIAGLAQRIGSDEQGGLAETERLIGQYPRDPRLHFLHGSLLAGMRRYVEAVEPMRRAVDIAPDYAVARFQLGFLLLTSGHAVRAEEAWGPLYNRPAADPFRLFALGLGKMVRADFPGAIALLREGMLLNEALPPLNGDMQKLIDEMQARAGAEGEEPTSAAHMLLQQYQNKTTRH